MAKSIKRNFIYNIILNVSKVIFPLITAPYVSRVLEPDGVGLFNFANTYAGYFALFAGLGIPFYGIREIAKISEDDKAQTKFVSEMVSISAMVTALCTLLYIASIFLIPQLNENFVIFLIAAAALYITPLRIDWFFSGKEEFGYIALRSIIMKTLSVIALFVLVHDKDDLIIYVILNSLSQVLNELWNYIKLLRLGIRPYFTLKGMQHLKPLLILFSSSVAMSVYTTLDTLMLGFMTNYDEVGYYNNATHISKALVPIVTSLAAVAMPRLSKYKEATGQQPNAARQNPAIPQRDPRTNQSGSNIWSQAPNAPYAQNVPVEHVGAQHDYSHGSTPIGGMPQNNYQNNLDQSERGPFGDWYKDVPIWFWTVAIGGYAVAIFLAGILFTLLLNLN